MSNDTFDINSILDGTLDDLADIPEFKAFPPGTHRCVIYFETNTEDKANPFITLKLKALETVELPSGSTDDPVSKDQETNKRYYLANEYGQGDFKEVMKQLGEHFGPQSNRDMMAAAQNAEALVVTDTRIDKKDKSKKYLEIKAIQIV
jgi:hypothetical protein